MAIIKVGYLVAVCTALVAAMPPESPAPAAIRDTDLLQEESQNYQQTQQYRDSQQSGISNFGPRDNAFDPDYQNFGEPSEYREANFQGPRFSGQDFDQRLDTQQVSPFGPSQLSADQSGFRPDGSADQQNLRVGFNSQTFEQSQNFGPDSFGISGQRSREDQNQQYNQRQELQQQIPEQRQQQQQFQPIPEQSPFNSGSLPNQRAQSRYSGRPESRNIVQPANRNFQGSNIGSSNRQQYESGQDYLGEAGDPSFGNYQYSYDIRSEDTGDMKYHKESRDGGKVIGEYRVREADGSMRIVKYTADAENGFQATVEYVMEDEKPLEFGAKMPSTKEARPSGSQRNYGSRRVFESTIQRQRPSVRDNFRPEEDSQLQSPRDDMALFFNPSERQGLQQSRPEQARFGGDFKQPSVPGFNRPAEQYQGQGLDSQRFDGTQQSSSFEGPSPSPFNQRDQYNEAQSERQFQDSRDRFQGQEESKFQHQRGIGFPNQNRDQFQFQDRNPGQNLNRNQLQNQYKNQFQNQDINQFQEQDRYQHQIQNRNPFQQEEKKEYRGQDRDGFQAQYNNEFQNQDRTRFQPQKEDQFEYDNRNQFQYENPVRDQAGPRQQFQTQQRRNRYQDSERNQEDSQYQTQNNQRENFFQRQNEQDFHRQPFQNQNISPFQNQKAIQGQFRNQLVPVTSNTFTSARDQHFQRDQERLQDTPFSQNLGDQRSNLRRGNFQAQFQDEYQRPSSFNSQRENQFSPQKDFQDETYDQYNDQRYGTGSQARNFNGDGVYNEMNDNRHETQRYGQGSPAPFQGSTHFMPQNGFLPQRNSPSSFRAQNEFGTLRSNNFQDIQQQGRNTRPNNEQFIGPQQEYESSRQRQNYGNEQFIGRTPAVGNNLQNEDFPLQSNRFNPNPYNFRENVNAPQPVSPQISSGSRPEGVQGLDQNPNFAYNQRQDNFSQGSSGIIPNQRPQRFETIAEPHPQP
ncbi:hypothetical protein SK128_000243 [Halocaridina rubra]|uniref:Uncharacterized protein n=1 Tax=Halocaridina rubra TaxID=373956 RepID=A0AAN8ZZ71_HALRR